MKKATVTLGEAIYHARQERGITLRQLARTVGISAPFMSDVEHGRRKPSEERLAAIAKALHMSAQKLQDMTLTREAANALENDPELLALSGAHRGTVGSARSCSTRALGRGRLPDVGARKHRIFSIERRYSGGATCQRKISRFLHIAS